MTLQPANREVHYAGDVVFEEGASGGRAYLIDKGRVEITTEVDGRRVVLGELGRGEIFGEMALIDDSPRMATATAVEETVLRVIPRQLFHSKLANCDPFVSALLRIFVRNIRSLTHTHVRKVLAEADATAESSDDDAVGVENAAEEAPQVTAQASRRP